MEIDHKNDLTKMLFGPGVVVLPAPVAVPAAPVIPDMPAAPSAPVIPVAPVIPDAPAAGGVHFNHNDLVARVEGILRWGTEYVDVKERAGRLWLVDYQPMRRLDPDLLVWAGEMSRKVARFDRATGDFQHFRRSAARSAGQWQRAARRAALRYLDAFAALEPTNEEAALFAAWVRRITGSHTAGHVFDGL